MKSKLYALFTIILFLPGCFDAQQTGHTHTFFIQAPLESPAIKQLQSDLKPVIDEIIQEQLGQPQDKNFPIFFFKKRQAVTVYYINDLYDNNEPLGGLMYLFVEPALNNLPKPKAPQHAALTPDVNFFGEPKKGLFSALDLVVVIDDPQQELSTLNQQLKTTMHHANQEYRRAYGIDLYNRAQSERHPFLPHITLGHLRTNYIKHLVNDSSRADGIIKNIKQQIAQAVSDALHKLTPEERTLSFDSLALYNARSKKYVHKKALL